MRTFLGSMVVVCALAAGGVANAAEVTIDGEPATVTSASLGSQASGRIVR